MDILKKIKSGKISQAEAGRQLGISRQAIHQQVHCPPRGNVYIARCWYCPGTVMMYRNRKKPPQCHDCKVEGPAVAEPAPGGVLDGDRQDESP